MSFRLELIADVVTGETPEYQSIRRYFIMKGNYPEFSQFIVDNYEQDCGNSNSVITTMTCNGTETLIKSFVDNVNPDSEDFDEGEVNQILSKIDNLRELERTVGTIFIDIKVTW